MLSRWIFMLLKYKVSNDSRVVLNGLSKSIQGFSTFRLVV